MDRIGILLINLGTPDNSHPRAVYRYLREFLHDPRVIDLPALVRYALTDLVIVPTRHRNSAKAYQQIWTAEGSPLLVNTRKLSEALGLRLTDRYKVAIGMRYGNPSIDHALTELAHCEHLLVLPLFPQYSSAANGSAIQAFMEAIQGKWNIPSLQIVNDFYQHPGYIRAYAKRIQTSLQNVSYQKLLMSYHGLPERHIQKSKCTASCDLIAACPAITSANLFCYRAQCYATSRLLAQALKLADSQYQVCFQSRLGRTPWIKPYTDLILPELRSQGIEDIAIVSPSFVADCLETLEEINIRLRETWTELGGRAFTFVPCLNDDDNWIEALAQIIENKLGAYVEST